MLVVMVMVMTAWVAFHIPIPVLRRAVRDRKIMAEVATETEAEAETETEVKRDTEVKREREGEGGKGTPQ